MPLYRLRYLASRRSPTQYRTFSGRYWSRGWVDLETRVFVGKPVDDTLYLLGEAVKVTSQVAPPDELALELTFYEGSGTVVHDSSKYGNHGTIYGAVWTEENGVYGLHFDGIDDYGVIPHNDVLAFSTEDFTITIVWRFVRRSIAYASVLSKGVWGQEGWAINSETDNTGFSFVDAAHQIKYYTSTLTTELKNKISMLTFVRKGSEWIWYVNGEVDNSGTFKEDLVKGTLDLYIMARPDLTGYVESDLFYVGIWRRALTDSEIREIYEAVVGILPLG